MGRHPPRRGAACALRPRRADLLLHRPRPGRPHPRRPGDLGRPARDDPAWCRRHRRSTARPGPWPPPTAGRSPTTRWCSPPARTPRCRRCPARTCAALRLPHDRRRRGPAGLGRGAAQRARPPAARCRGRRRPARPGGGRCAASPRGRDARRRVRAAPDAAAGRRRAAARLCAAHRGPGRHRADAVPRRSKIAGRHGRVARMELRRRPGARRRRRRLRGGRSRPATSSPGTAGWRSASAAASSSTTPAARQDPRIWAIGEVRLHPGPLPRPRRARATRWPRSSPTGCSAARAPSPAPTSPPSSSSSASTSPASATRSRRRRAASRSSISDPVAGVYKKLVMSDDARTLLGGILVGDASAYAALRPMVGRELGGDPAAYLLPEGSAAGAGRVTCPTTRPSAPATTSPRATIRCAVTDGGCTDLAGVKACTQGRHQLRLLPAAGQEAASTPSSRSPASRSATALCEHFDLLAGPALRHRPRAGADHLQRDHRRATAAGRGCDICKPVIASILASLGTGHILDGERASLQDTNDHFLANMQKDGTYSVVPRIPGGEITPEKLIVIGEVAKDFGLYTKITGGQRIDLFGARIEQLPAIWTRLVDAGFESGHAYGKSLRTVKSCVGLDLVPLRRAGLGRPGHRRSSCATAGCARPHKLKLGVSGCARECAEARGKDVGVIATENGWNLYVGGNGGFTPRHAQLLAEDLDTETLVRDHRPVPHVLHPHRRPAAAHRRLARGARRRPRRHPRPWCVDDSLGHLRRPRRRHGRARRRLRGRVGRDPRRPREAARASRPSSTRPNGPTRRSPTSASAVRPDPPRPRSALAQGSSSPARPWRSAHDHRADTGRRGPAQRLGGGLPPLRPPPGARCRGPGGRRAGRALPHPRRHGLRAPAVRPLLRGQRALARDRRAAAARSPRWPPRCTSRSSTCAPASASTPWAASPWTWTPTPSGSSRTWSSWAASRFPHTVPHDRPCSGSSWPGVPCSSPVGALSPRAGSRRWSRRVRW